MSKTFIRVVSRSIFNKKRSPSYRASEISAYCNCLFTQVCLSVSANIVYISICINIHMCVLLPSSVCMFNGSVCTLDVFVYFSDWCGGIIQRPEHTAGEGSCLSQSSSEHLPQFKSASLDYMSVAPHSTMIGWRNISMMVKQPQKIYATLIYSGDWVDPHIYIHHDIHPPGYGEKCL